MVRTKRLWQGPTSAKPINIPDSLITGPRASLTALGTRQGRIRVVLSDLGRRIWQQERASDKNKEMQKDWGMNHVGILKWGILLKRIAKKKKKKRCEICRPFSMSWYELVSHTALPALNYTINRLFKTHSIKHFVWAVLTAETQIVYKMLSFGFLIWWEGPFLFIGFLVWSEINEYGVLRH